MSKGKNRIAIAINIAIIIFEIIGIIVRLNVKHSIGIEYYTMDSNLLALISAILYIFSSKRKQKKSVEISILKLISTVMLTVTFLVVVFVLSPMLENGHYILMLTDQMLYNHTICPILAILSFIFFEEYALKKSHIIWPIASTAIYAVILITLNLLHIIDGPYPFLQVYNQPVIATIGWSILILGGTGALSYLYYAIKKHQKSLPSR